MQTQQEWCQYPGVKTGSFRAREKKRKEKKKKGRKREGRTRKRERDRKKIHSFKYIGLAKKFIQERKKGKKKRKKFF